MVSKKTRRPIGRKPEDPSGVSKGKGALVESNTGVAVVRWRSVAPLDLTKSGRKKEERLETAWTRRVFISMQRNLGLGKQSSMK